MIGRLDCRVAVDSGSGGRVDRVVAAAGAVGVFAMLLFCFVGMAVMGVFVVATVSGPQLTSNKILINPVKYSLIKRNMSNSILEL